MPITGQIITVTITDLAFGGDGLARLDDGAVVFVPFTAVGDVAEVEVTDVRKSFLRAELRRLLTPGPGRAEPACRHYGVCGGCVYQHLDYPTQCAAKQKQLADLMARIGKFAAFPAPEPAVPSPLEYGYRNKLRLEPTAPIRDDQGVRLGYGYCQRDNKTFFLVRSCPLGMPCLNDLLPKAVRSAWGSQNAKRPKPYTLTLRVPANGEPTFYFGHASPKVPWLHETVLGEDVSVPLDSFWQVNPPVADRVIGTVAAWFRETGARALIDAYGGVGTFSLAIGQDAQFRVVIENDRLATAAAEYNHAQKGLKAQVILGSTEVVLPRVLTKITPAETAVILDPPRTGCQPKAIAAIRNTRPGHVLYVSCNPATLARDLKALCQDGLYRPVRSAWFDMFPQTPHFETAVLLQKEPTP
ncbi:MAG: class I SAM-dependent RNA methyltransferase [Lentisphaeria bacterium]|nr:class I SAM-dependent RNA methyltransferase [Lentisphaeria bacterium]